MDETVKICGAEDYHHGSYLEGYEDGVNRVWKAARVIMGMQSNEIYEAFGNAANVFSMDAKTMLQVLEKYAMTRFKKGAWIMDGNKTFAQVVDDSGMDLKVITKAGKEEYWSKTGFLMNAVPDPYGGIYG